MKDYVIFSSLMAINIKVTKQGNENTASVLRKFSFKVRGSGILMQVRKRMYREKPISRNMRKYAALKRLAKRQEIQKLIKEGKLKERKVRNIPTSTSGR